MVLVFLSTELANVLIPLAICSDKITYSDLSSKESVQEMHSSTARETSKMEWRPLSSKWRKIMNNSVNKRNKRSKKRKLNSLKLSVQCKNVNKWALTNHLSLKKPNVAKKLKLKKNRNHKSKNKLNKSQRLKNLKKISLLRMLTIFQKFLNKISTLCSIMPIDTLNYQKKN